MVNQDFKAQSYAAHEQHYKSSQKVFRRLENKESIDFWRHERMYNTLSPFIQDKKDRWLTVGDGVGTDANWLQDQSLAVVASDISDVILTKAHEKGYVKEFSKENAEHLSSMTALLTMYFARRHIITFPALTWLYTK